MYVHWGTIRKIEQYSKGGQEILIFKGVLKYKIWIVTFLEGILHTGSAKGIELFYRAGKPCTTQDSEPGWGRMKVHAGKA